MISLGISRESDMLALSIRLLFLSHALSLSHLEFFLSAAFPRASIGQTHLDSYSSAYLASKSPSTNQNRTDSFKPPDNGGYSSAQ